MKISSITLSGGEKISLISNLSTMLTAGIPILEAVNSLIEDAKGNQLRILTALRDDLSQGKRVSASFANFPKVFDKVTVNIIKAAEESGTLEVALQDIKTNIKKEMEFTDKIKSAMIYPLLIMTVFIGVLVLILVVVIPKISIVFSRLKVELPLPTQVLIFSSNLLVNNTWSVLGGLALVVATIIVFFKVKRDLVLGVLFSLPLISKLVREIDLTRFSRSLHLLLSSGLTITAALELTQDVVMKKSTGAIIAKSKDMILAGKKLSEGMRLAKGHIPAIMIKLIEVGEKSGSLDKAMQDISEYLDYEVSNTLKTITVLLEPMMLLFVGLMVGAMMLAIIAPIYSLIGQVGGAR